MIGEYSPEYWYEKKKVQNLEQENIFFIFLIFSNYHSRGVSTLVRKESKTKNWKIWNKKTFFIFDLILQVPNLPLEGGLYGDYYIEFPHRGVTSGRFGTWSIRSNKKNVFLSQIFQFLVLVLFGTSNLPLEGGLYGD